MTNSLVFYIDPVLCIKWDHTSDLFFFLIFKFALESKFLCSIAGSQKWPQMASPWWIPEQIFDCGILALKRVGARLVPWPVKAGHKWINWRRFVTNWNTAVCCSSSVSPAGHCLGNRKVKKSPLGCLWREEQSFSSRYTTFIELLCGVYPNYPKNC